MATERAELVEAQLKQARRHVDGLRESVREYEDNLGHIRRQLDEALHVLAEWTAVSDAINPAMAVTF